MKQIDPVKKFSKFATNLILLFIATCGVIILAQMSFYNGHEKGYNEAMQEIENVIDYNTMTVESIDSLEAMIKRRHNN